MFVLGFFAPLQECSEPDEQTSRLPTARGSALCALSLKCPVGGATSASVWWLQKVWKPSGPPRRGGRT